MMIASLYGSVHLDRCGLLRAFWKIGSLPEMPVCLTDDHSSYDVSASEKHCALYAFNIT